MSLVLFAVIVIVLAAVIIVTQLRVRTQRLATYWIEPLVLLVLCWVVIDKHPSLHWQGLYLAGALLGILIGVLRGRATEIVLGGKPGTFTAQGSWITVALLLLVAGTNLGARLILSGQPAAEVERVTSPLLLVPAFNVIAWRVVLLARYLKLERARQP